MSSSINIMWPILALMVVFVALAVSIIITTLTHSKKIRESENRFRLLFDSVFDSIVLLDENCNLVDVNKSFCNLLGFMKKELLESPLTNLIAREKWAGLQEEIAKSLASGIGYLGETDLVSKKGKVVHAEVGGTGIRINGNRYVLASFRDIGARILTENALKNKNAAMAELLTHLENEKMKFKLQIATAIDNSIMPALNKLINPDGSASMAHVDALKDNVKEMAISAGGMMHAYGKLTPREIEICNLVRAGATSKDISDALRISILTVNKHRERIRKKLVIVKKDINLSTFLKRR